MTDPTRCAERRVRALLAALDPGVYNLGDEIVYSDAFRSQEWPRTAYALNRPDLEAVLVLLDQARSHRLAHPAEAVDPAVHTPERIRAYLTQRGWAPCPKQRGYYWISDELPDASLFVHPAVGAADYALRTGLLAKDLADADGTGELQVLAEIAQAGRS